MDGARWTDKKAAYVIGLSMYHSTTLTTRPQGDEDNRANSRMGILPSWLPGGASGECAMRCGVMQSGRWAWTESVTGWRLREAPQGPMLTNHGRGSL